MDGAASYRWLFGPAFVLGFAFSGLFDGILLHQLLQWHHLLSLVEGDAFRDLRVQVFADGAFHILMYGVAAVGLWLLWRARDHLAAERGRGFIGAFVLGFGVWNVIDAVVFHWILRIHHIRLDPDEALLSDVLWLVGLGLVPLAIGWRLWRGGGGGGGGPATRAAVGLAALVMVSAATSLVPSRSPLTTVLFRPGTTEAEMLQAVAAVDGRLAWVGGEGELAVMALNDQASRWALYRHGAILVGGAGPAGCLAWARPA